MIDKITTIENKIHQLKQKKDRIQNQQALFLMKETQKTLKEDFSLETALNILKDSWTTSSKTQKTEWKKCDGSFPKSSPKTHKKTENHPSAPEQSRKTEVQLHEHS